MTTPTMSSDGESSDASEEAAYVFYRDRPEWRDVAPVPQDDGPNPVVSIAYSDKFRDVFDYMRAVWQSNELSERALALTADAIDCNAANYTVWHFRRKILQALGKDLKDEFLFTFVTIKEQPKNYQVWYHRQKLVEWTGDASKELELTADVFEEDAKNYHAWQHRQWVIKKFVVWDGELAFVDKLLTKDLRNNSAWNQRYFVLSNTTSFSDDIVDREVQYALSYIRKAPNNESSWNFLQGVLRGRRLLAYPGLRGALEEMFAQRIRSPFLLSTLVDMHEEGAGLGAGPEDEERAAHLKVALELCSLLANEVDTIRKLYWEYTSRRITQAFSREK